ncbi:IS701 family transposase [Streptomyces sp. 8N616]|uniref:IS701 family transposase n=1 Tax=Streptomyces sp. 8N616 TaxID=3457414 RepID=UPI003FD1E28E
MNQVVLTRGDLRPPGREPEGARAANCRVDDVPSVLFDSFRRSDQRGKAGQYLTGLLRAEGRKSMRNIAALFGGQATEQSLHHFISSSTWDWRPVRRALARHLDQAMAPQAWVVQSVPIPKTGRHSVGVDRIFVPELGQTVNGQQAYGVWLAGAETSVPVSWRLFLPPSWVNDPARRHKAEIPATAREERPDACAAAAVLDSVGGWQLRRRPVLMDARLHDVGGVVRRFLDARVPLVTRIGGTSSLVVADPAMPGYGRGALPAQRILESVPGLRRPVEWADPAVGPARRTTLVAAVRVILPDIRAGGAVDAGPPTRPAGGGQRSLLLLGEWRSRTAPAQLWLTDMTSAPASSLLVLTKLAGRVSRDFAEHGDPVGLRDFEGRSFRGWHRHMTLASAAHAVSVLGARGPGGPRYVPEPSACPSRPPRPS